MRTGKATWGRWLRDRMLDYKSRGFESLGGRSVGVSRLTLALALEVGNPTHLRSLYISHKSITPGQFNQILLIGLKNHNTNNNLVNCHVR